MYTFFRAFKRIHFVEDGGRDDGIRLRMRESIGVKKGWALCVEIVATEENERLQHFLYSEYDALSEPEQEVGGVPLSRSFLSPNSMLLFLSCAEV
jgi:hypothetical protein